MIFLHEKEAFLQKNFQRPFFKFYVKYGCIFCNLNFWNFCPPYWIHDFEFCESNDGFVISDLKNPYTVCILPKNQLNFFGLIIECSSGSNFYDFRCSWFFFLKSMHFYKKSLQAFFISNYFLNLEFLSSNPPFWILQIWQRIRDQRP